MYKWNVLVCCKTAKWKRKYISFKILLKINWLLVSWQMTMPAKNKIQYNSKKLEIKYFGENQKTAKKKWARSHDLVVKTDSPVLYRGWEIASMEFEWKKIEKIKFVNRVNCKKLTDNNTSIFITKSIFLSHMLSFQIIWFFC